MAKYGSSRKHGGNRFVLWLGICSIAGSFTMYRASFFEPLDLPLYDAALPWQDPYSDNTTAGEYGSLVIREDSNRTSIQIGTDRSNSKASTDRLAFGPTDKTNDTVGKSRHLAPLLPTDREFYTVRINTWNRPENLYISLHHHASCEGVAQIQVVWCDSQGEPPAYLQNMAKVVVERHSVNSLNERFHVMTPPPTLGILSMDDDVLRPCEALDAGFLKWTQNPERLVGYDARAYARKSDGAWRYRYPFLGDYSIVLPRFCFLHCGYLESYSSNLPRDIYRHVEEWFNCEDIAMSLWVSHLTGSKPPLLADGWAMGAVLELESNNSISSTVAGHRRKRDRCLDSFATQLELKDALENVPIIQPESDRLSGHFEDVEYVARLLTLLKNVTEWKHRQNTSRNWMTANIGVLKSAVKDRVIGLRKAWQRERDAG